MSNSTTSKLVNSVRRAKDPKTAEEQPEEKVAEKSASKPATKSTPEKTPEQPRVIKSSRTWPD